MAEVGLYELLGFEEQQMGIAKLFPNHWNRWPVGGLFNMSLLSNQCLGRVDVRVGWLRVVFILRVETTRWGVSRCGTHGELRFGSFCRSVEAGDGAGDVVLQVLLCCLVWSVLYQGHCTKVTISVIGCIGNVQGMPSWVAAWVVNSMVIQGYILSNHSDPHSDAQIYNFLWSSRSDPNLWSAILHLELWQVLACEQSHPIPQCMLPQMWEGVGPITIYSWYVKRAMDLWKTWCMVVILTYFENTNWSSI